MTKPLTTAEGAREAAKVIRAQADRIGEVDSWAWTDVAEAAYFLRALADFYTQHPEMEVHE